MLELTTLIIFTWLTLRVRYFHSYIREYLIFDVNLNNYALVRWISSLIMTSDPTSATPMTTDEFLLMKRSSKIELHCAKRSRSSSNLMHFVQVIPAGASSQPHPRSGHRAIATESDFWIWGGYYPEDGDQREQMFRELWRFNFALQRWTLEKTTGDGPTQSLASHAMCLDRDIVFVFGGTGFPFGQHISSDLFLLDLKRRHWRRCPVRDQQLPPVYGASMILDQEYLYILCGTNSWVYNTDVYEIHLPTLRCRQIGHTFDEIEDPSETGRYRQEAFLHNRKIFLFGGGGATGISYSLENVPVFDLDTHVWSFIRTNPHPVHNFPTSRKFHSVLPFRSNQVIMFGGASFNPNTGDHVMVNDLLWTFNFEKFEWNTLPSLKMPRATFFHAGTMNERGEIWMHGGIIRNPAVNDDNAPNRQIRTSDLFMMNSRVPNLSELCWTLFLNSIVDRSSLIHRKDLVDQISLPPRFRQRIH